jgi:hypothetical protein
VGSVDAGSVIQERHHDRRLQSGTVIVLVDGNNLLLFAGLMLSVETQCFMTIKEAGGGLQAWKAIQAVIKSNNQARILELRQFANLK